MSLLEQNKKLEQEKNERIHKEQVNKRKELANKINKAMKNQELINLVEKRLVDRGSVYVSGFGCLCQGGFCDWQKGFEVFLKDLIQEWDDKGVRISFHIEGVYFLLKGARLKTGTYSINYKTLESRYV